MYFIDICNNGSDEIINNIKKQSKKALSQIEHDYQITREYKFDVTGQFYDIGLVLSGEPEAWLQQIEDEVRKQVEINVNASFLSKHRSGDIINNASRIVGIIMMLEEMNVDVKFNLRFQSNEIYSGNYNKNFLVSLVAKDYGQGVDYKKLSALLHTSMFRRGVFRMREVEVDYKLGKMSGIGSTNPIKGDTLIYDTKSIDELERKLFGEKK